MHTKNYRFLGFTLNKVLIFMFAMVFTNETLGFHSML